VIWAWCRVQGSSWYEATMLGFLYSIDKLATFLTAQFASWTLKRQFAGSSILYRIFISGLAIRLLFLATRERTIHYSFFKIEVHSKAFHLGRRFSWCTLILWFLISFYDFQTRLFCFNRLHSATNRCTLHWDFIKFSIIGGCTRKFIGLLLH
jgi:hypothetical protein